MNIIIIGYYHQHPFNAPFGRTKAMLRGGFERPNDAEEEMHFQQQDTLQARNPIPIHDPRDLRELT